MDFLPLFDVSKKLIQLVGFLMFSVRAERFSSFKGDRFMYFWHSEINNNMESQPVIFCAFRNSDGTEGPLHFFDNLQQIGFSKSQKGPPFSAL